MDICQNLACQASPFHISALSPFPRTKPEPPTSRPARGEHARFVDAAWVEASSGGTKWLETSHREVGRQQQGVLVGRQRMRWRVAMLR